MKKKLAAKRESYDSSFRRPAWKLLLKSLLYAAPLALRNWRRRRHGDFPVMILYHHLVSDRPHRFGVSTVYFLRQVNYLLLHHRVGSLSETVELLRQSVGKRRTLALPFD